MECLIPHKHTLKILYKSKHFPPTYKRKRKWVFLSDVQTKETPTRVFFLYLGGKCFDLYTIFMVCLWVIRHCIEICVNLNIFHGDRL